MQTTDKPLSNMFCFIKGNIADKTLLDSKQIDTIVNAANPTLMGSSQGVDGAIHKAVYELSGRKKCLDKRICKETQTSTKKGMIRCRRGSACMTSGYKLCRNIIHVVGAEYDGTSQKKENCSSSRISITESCYSEIVALLKKHTDIKRIGIPIIGSGRYGFPYDLAVRIAITSVFNSLLEWKEKDPEQFAMAGVDKIYFFIYDSCESACEEHMKTAMKIYREYEPYIKDERRVVMQNSTQAHFRYMREIARYDEKRGYFAIAKTIRLLLMGLRIFFLPPMWLKDRIGGRDWKKRRRYVEVLALVKMILPLSYYQVLVWLEKTGFEIIGQWILGVLAVYAIVDTMSYLMTLIVMSDIQKPSANIIRSMLMLFVNYVEVSLDMTFLYWLSYRKVIGFKEALLFGVLGERQIVELTANVDYIWPYVDGGVRFFFMSLVFGYFANHLKQRKFRS